MSKLETKLKEFDFIYRETLDIPKEIKFGIEIEFTTAIYKMVKEQIEKFNRQDRTIYCKMPSYLELFEDYSKWKCVNDGSVQYEDTYKNLCGGEINSPILCNNKECSETIKKICEILKTTPNIKIDERCGLHIHIDRNIYGKTAEPFIKLMKLWMIYEDIIYRFAYGENNKERLLIKTNSKPINAKIYKELYNLEKIKNDSFEKAISKFKNKNQGITFFYTKGLYEAILNTIEVRVFNGTINETIIQNDINFIINLLLYAKSTKFDEELIEYQIKKFKPIELEQFRNKNIEKANTLANLLFEKEIDKMYFMKQYLKSFKKEEIIDKQYTI